MAKFTQYKYFKKVVDLNSMAKAAEELNVTASAISKQISALESDLGVALFERHFRKIILTERGQAFYQKCKDILELIDQAEFDAMKEAGDVNGTLKITLSNSISSSTFMGLFKQFVEQYPKVTFNLHVSEAFEDLWENMIDFAFRIGELPDYRRLTAYPLMQVRPVFCASKLYIEENGYPTCYADLKNHQVGMLPFMDLSENVRQILKAHRTDFNFQSCHQFSNIHLLTQSVEAGFCIGLLLDYTIKDKLDTGDLMVVFPDDPLPEKFLYLISKLDKYPTELSQLFKSHITSNFKK